MTKRVAILQSNYIPWKGYFDMIAAVDEFILYDDVQFTKNDWRNRNQIKTPQGLQWLTVPTGKNIHRRICDVTLEDASWQMKHWKTLENNYRRAEYFSAVAACIAPLYSEMKHVNLTAMNHAFIQVICTYLGIGTRLRYSWDYPQTEGKTQRLVDMCIAAGAAEYISGPSAKSYIDPAMFAQAGIKLSWFDYDGYPTYTQLWGEFVHGVSILDVLFNCGPTSPQMMRYVGK